MNKKKVLPIFIACLVVVLATLACVDTPVAAENPNCQPTATEAVSLPVDETLDWQVLGTDAHYESCGVVLDDYYGNLRYTFQQNASALVQAFDMLKITFSDGGIKYFKIERGSMYLAIP